MTMKAKAAAPCATCPWLAANQTAAARKKAPRCHGERYAWYDVPNLRRLWKGYQTGHPTMCHSTDPESSEYGGSGAKEGHQRICVGGLILVARCMEVVNERSRRREKRKPWAGLFTREGMVYWVEMLMYRGAMMGPSVVMMPTTFDADAAKRVRVPWTDPMLNAVAKDG